MKVFVLTNLFPREVNLASGSADGVFITRRIEQCVKLGIDYTAVPVWFKDGWLDSLARRLLRKEQINPVKEFNGVQYSRVDCKRKATWLVWRLIRKINLITEEHIIAKQAESFARCVESRFDLSSFDLIHAHGMYTLPAGLIAQILSEKYSKPYVLTVHGSDVNILMEKRKKVYLDVFESAQAVIFVSNALLEKARSFGYSGKNAVVIPNGYDPQIFRSLDKDQVRRQLGIYTEGYKYVGFVGNLIEIKRADKLVEIFDMIRKGYPKVKFIVVGVGHLRDKMEQEAEDKGLEVLFTGRLDQSEVAKYMNAMDVMVLPSRNEGWPCVVLEAQVCGTCVVGSSNGGIPEAIGFQEYVVEEGPDFEERFAKKVVEVLRSGYDRQKIVQRAQKYTWEYIVKMEKQVYEAVLQEKKEECITID
ncbi:MAG: glycosyltransferase family 4 protein [Fervidobacterium sp.]|uniref:Glycosyltransferase family 4 protein n=1 Tax=Fervidobacterium pennivorans TaxID=93466 RepID=A0A7C4VVC3_FERPE|nr:glycosyltransferase family 4 protein [Fervidobacterium sp.]